MTEILRTRDCIIFYRSDCYPVRASSVMLAAGWSGGQGVGWVDAPDDSFMVGFTDGLFGGFTIWGSDEPADQFTSFVGNQLETGYIVFCAGSWRISTSTYEKYTYASRQAGPLVPITYVEGTKLRFSLRGLWTVEDEWTLSSDPRGSNQSFGGIVMQAPSALNNYYLGVQTSL